MKALTYVIVISALLLIASVVFQVIEMCDYNLFETLF